jgi:DNA-binding NtrC family response regulator
MPSPTIVIAQRDPRVVLGLTNDLQPHFPHVAIAQNAEELRELLERHEAHMAVIDLETVDVQEVRNLCALFGDLVIVCTHRSPDEQMWTSALNAGAVEFCHPHDVRSILHASRMAPPHPCAPQEQEEDAALAA